MKIVHAAANQAINLNTFSTEKSGAVVKNKSFEVYKVILEKGEEMEWFIQDRDTYVLKRIKKSKSVIINKKKKLG